MMTAKERRLLEWEMKCYREYLQSPRVCQSCGQTFPNKDFLLVTEPIENSWLQRLCPECHEVWEDGRDNLIPT